MQRCCHRARKQIARPVRLGRQHAAHAVRALPTQRRVLQHAACRTAILCLSARLPAVLGLDQLQHSTELLMLPRL